MEAWVRIPIDRLGVVFRHRGRGDVPSERRHGLHRLPQPSTTHVFPGLSHRLFPIGAAFHTTPLAMVHFLLKPAHIGRASNLDAMIAQFLVTTHGQAARIPRKSKGPIGRLEDDNGVDRMPRTGRIVRLLRFAAACLARWRLRPVGHRTVRLGFHSARLRLTFHIDQGHY